MPFTFKFEVHLCAVSQFGLRRFELAGDSGRNAHLRPVGGARRSPQLGLGLKLIPTAAQPAVAVGPANAWALLNFGSLLNTKAFRGRVQGAAGR